MTFMIPAAIAAATQVMQGQAQGRALNDAAEGLDANAAGVRRASSADEDTLRRQQAQQLGKMRASADQSGFVNTGSLADIQAKSAAEMELDALTNRYKSELQAVGYENEARTMRANAKAAKRSGYLNAFSTLASAGGQQVYGGGPRIGGPAPVESRNIG
jgi:hypothetical protein